MILLVLALLQEPSVSDLIRSLDDDDIAVRRRAADELQRRGPAVEEALWVAVLRGGSLEAVLTAKDLLAQLGKPIRSARTRWGLPVVDDSERRFGRLKDDAPQVEFGR
jgi:hypothetical protein